PSLTRSPKHKRPRARAALEQRLADEDPSVDAEAEERAAEEEAVEEPLRLNEQRYGAVIAAIRAGEARSGVDLGCGNGKLLRALLADPSFSRIVCVDVSHAALDRARHRLRLDQLAPRQRGRIQLFQTALTYRDRRLAGFDAAAVVEVIEHLYEPRLRSFERVVFGHARPKNVVVTTPNSEFNAKFEGLPAGRFRR